MAKIGGASQHDSGGRPEAFRRRTIGANAQIVIGFGALGLPLALYGLWLGMQLPFVLAMITLGAGFVSLALHRHGQYERAAAVQAYGILVVGAVLAVVDPAIADFGLAVALLAPVHASLLARTPVKKRTWAGLVAVVALAALSSTGLLGWPEAYRPEFILLGGLAFVAVALVVLHSANRLNSVFEVYEKAQISAYRHLIENVQDAVLSFTADGSLLFASRSSEQLFGCRRYELAGGGLVERVHLLDRPAFLTGFAGANVDGKSTTVEIRMRHDDPAISVPRYAWVEVALSPVTDGVTPGERYEVVALLRDVTTRRDQDDAMRRARQQAEEASTAKSHFLATIGHELRTPLNAIVGFSEMMTSGVVGELAPTHREYAGLIHKSGTHLIEVVNMLLDVSRIEAGRFELRTEEFAPEALVEPCLQIVRPLAEARKVRLITDMPRQLPMILADERACRQVVINLMSNAIKFSSEGAAVTLAIRRQGQHLNISVADSGVGMDEPALKRIGEPFFQVHSGLARGYEGTGLGLSIVKGIVELHDGTLHATSAPGEGTVMTVLLPINGPATKTVDTASVTPLHLAPVQRPMPEWQDDGRKRAL